LSTSFTGREAVCGGWLWLACLAGTISPEQLGQTEQEPTMSIRPPSPDCFCRIILPDEMELPMQLSLSPLLTDIPLHELPPGSRSFRMRIRSSWKKKL